MQINGANVDVSKLYSREALVNHLKDNGESDRALSKIRGRYFEAFGNELIWRYPASDGLHAGVLIVAVQEGFLSLPYDYMDKTDGELFELDRVSLFNEDALKCFIDDWKFFSDDLHSVLNDMMRITKENAV
jgi:hypothetical protein